MSVHLAVSGVVPRKLVPEKKGSGSEYESQNPAVESGAAGAGGFPGMAAAPEVAGSAAHEQAVLSRPAHLRTLPPPPSPPAAAPVSPADYLEVAQKTLFSKDRNPNVVVDPPPPPKPEPPMPALPVYWGQMSFGDPVVILTAAKAPEQKSYHAGDNVGDFKLVAFDNDSITFDWNGKQVERKLLELAPKDAAAGTGSAGRVPPAPPAQVTNISPAAPRRLHRASDGGSGHGRRISGPA